MHYESYDDPGDDELRKALEAKYQGKTFEVTESSTDFKTRLSAIGGDELMGACMARIERDGAVNMAQYRFGLHYAADRYAEAILSLSPSCGKVD